MCVCVCSTQVFFTVLSIFEKTLNSEKITTLKAYLPPQKCGVAPFSGVGRVLVPEDWEHHTSAADQVNIKHNVHR